MEDVVWRADTGQYHRRVSLAPVLMPPMLGAPATASTAATPPQGGTWAWLGSREATNLLLLLILVCLILRSE